MRRYGGHSQLLRVRVLIETAEVRWFSSGVLPDDVQRWFVQAIDSPELCERFESREDFYLRIPDCEHIGAKLRAGTSGNLEIKVRNRAAGRFAFGSGCTGQVELWHKVAIERPELTSADSPLTSKALWTCVEKTRIQRKYSILNGAARAVGIDKAIERGCSVELTSLTLLESPWWTCGFEAFGQPDNESKLVGVLEQTASWVLKAFPYEPLVAENSYGYPAWLSRNGSMQ